MKLDNFEKVEDLVKQRNRILIAIDKCDKYFEKERDYNYWGQLSNHDDGSGEVVNLCGCFVLDDVVEATRGVLKTKLGVVDSQLFDLGIKV